MLLTTLLVACLGYIFITAPTAYAADARWEDDTKLVYDGLTYQGPGTVKSTDPMQPSVPVGATYYLAVKNNHVHIIYFEGSGNYLEADTAQHIRFDDTNGDGSLLENPTKPREISVSPRGPPSTEGVTSCAIEGLGWIICPMTMLLAKAMDTIYGLVAEFLKVRPLQTNTNTPLYVAWSFMQTIANVAFIIAFLIVIYSQVSGGGLSNYTVKKMMPRVIVAAVLVNISYWVCAVAVDLSNILGYAVQDLFELVRNSLVGKAGNSWELISWEAMGAFLLAGGTIAAGAGIAAYLTVTTLTAAAVGGGMIFVFIPILISVLFVVLITFLILAARQAIITILIVLAPLAFVAYLLPNTEKWFEKWRTVFFTLLLLFPAFSVVFGGSQLAAALIIQQAAGANSFILILLAMAVQVAPLAITPLLLKLGGGVLNRFAGIVNNPTKGVFDRGKAWAKERSDAATARGNRILSDRANRNLLNRRRFSAENMTYGRVYRQQRLEGEKSANEALTKGYFTQTAHGRSIHRLNERAKLEQGYGDHHNQAAWENTVRTNRYLRQRATQSHEAHERATLYKGEVDAAGAEHWQHMVQTTPGLRNIRHTTKMAEGRAKLYDDSMNAVDDAALQTSINTTPGLRNVKIQTDMANARAALEKSHVEADAKLQWQQHLQSVAGTAQRTTRTQTFLAEGQAKVIDDSMTARDDHEFRRVVEGSRELSRVVKDTHHDKKQAELYENIVQKAAEKSWNDRMRNDVDTQMLYLRSTRYEDGAAVAEKRLEEFTKEVRSRGEDTRGLQVGNEAIANTIRSTGVELAARGSAIETLDDEHQSFVLKQLTTDKAIRSVAGAGTQLGATKVLAKAQSGITKLYLENVKAQTSVYSNDGYRVDEMLKAMQDDTYRLHDGTQVDTIAQHAAVQHVLESIGNNWSVQKVIDWADTQGMYLDEKSGKYYDAAQYRAMGESAPVLSSDEVAERRDLLQMVVAGYRQGKNKVSYFTNTMQERMNRGLSSAWDDMTFSESSILNEAKQKKFDAERIANLDPDELGRMVQVLRNPEYRKQLTDEQRTAIVDGIVEAQTSTQTRHRIKGRERGLMNAVASYLELPPDRNPPDTELQDIEQYYDEAIHTDGDGNSFNVRVPRGTPGARKVKASVLTPNKYDYTRQSDYESGQGMQPPKRKR